MTSTRNDGHRTVGVVPYSYDGKMTVFLLIPKPNLQSSELPEFSDFSSTVDEINGQYYSASNAFLTQFTGNQVTPQVTSIKKMSERLEKKVGSDQVMPFHNPTYQHICYFVEMNPKLRPGKPCMWVPVDEMLMHCSSKGFLTTRLTFSTDEINRLKSWLHHIDAKFKSGGAEAWDPPIPGPINEIKSSNTSPTPPNPPVNTPTVNINTINTTATYPVLNKLPLGMSTNTNTIDITTPRTEALGLPSVAPSTPKYQFSSFNSTTPFSTAAITPTHSIRHPSPYNALPSSRCPSPSPFTNPYITASTPINYNSSDIRYTSPITMRPSSILDTNLTNSFTPLQFSTPLKTSTYGSDTPQRLLSLTNNSLPNTRFSSPVLRFQNDITPRVDSSLWNNGISPRISSWPSYSSNIPTSSYLATSASPAYTDYTKLTTNDTKSLYTQPLSTSDLSYKYSVSSSDYISPLQQTGSWFPSNSQPSHTPLANWQPTNQIHSTSTLLSQPYSQGFNTPLTGNNVSYHQPQNTQNWGSTSAFPDIGTYGSTTTYF